jgi:hypothetical protein
MADSALSVRRVFDGHGVAGSDTYGRVKTVGATPVVTKFAMLQGLPLFPLASFYYAGAGRRQSAGVPFVFGVENSAIAGLPLARVDRLSVAMAYFRGLCGALAVVGCLSVVPLVMASTGERLDEFAVTATKVLAGCLAVGVAGGALSYLLPLGVSDRERTIRLACGEVLGLEADPALLRADAARQIYDALDDGEGGGRSRRVEDADLPRLLAMTRLKIAPGGSREKLEERTDQILERLGRVREGGGA